MIIQTRLECQMEIDFPAATFSGYTLISGKERKIRLRVFTSYVGNAAPQGSEVRVPSALSFIN